MKIRILSGGDVRRALPMPRAIEAMKRAFGELSAGRAAAPLRSRFETANGQTLTMPAWLRASGEFCVKTVSIYPGNPAVHGLPVIIGTALVLDPESGQPLAFMESDTLTAIRTGAAGGLSAELLARAGATRVAVIGAGVQGRSVLRGVACARDISEVRIFSRTESSARAMAEEVGGWPGAPDTIVAASASDAVRDADIVIAATTSRTPVFNGDDLAPGAHVIGVGSYAADMQEVDARTVQRARVVVDSRESALAEAGDLIVPGATIDAEIGEIVNGDRPGRTSDGQITFFKSVGVAVQDAAAAAEVLRAAERENLGTVVEI